MQATGGAGSQGAGAAAAATSGAASSAVAFTPAGSRLRVLSFNVNGLRACLKRLRLKTMAQLLNQLNADIVCFQETKLRRADVDSELACVDGWDSFFCCDTTSSTGYSGTATYCRTEAALPCAAEEGFTGCAALAAPGANGTAAAAAAAAAGTACPHPALLAEFSVEELTELDAEGRVVVTDHGAFVLFNLYGPAITSEDDERAEQRSRFKHRFYKALELRWRDLLAQGRAVVAVGDFNITPAPIDCADPDPANHYRSASRRWMRHLLHGTARPGTGSAAPSGPQMAPLPAVGVQQSASLPAAAGVQQGGDSSAVLDWEAAEAAAAGGEAGSSPRWQGSAGSAAAGPGCSGSGVGGPPSRHCCFVDTFRHFYPARTDIATCWSTIVNARVNDYGSRIDLILTAGLYVGQPPPAAAAAAQPAGAPGHGWSSGASGGLANGGWGSGGVSGGSGAAGGLADGGRGSSGVGGSSGGAAGLVWVAASEIWKQQEGSDHCPVYADFGCSRGAFPCSTKAPAAAMRFAFAAKQHKLHRWLAPVQPGSSAAALVGASGNGCGDASPASELQQAQMDQQQEQQLRGTAAGAAGAGGDGLGGLPASQAGCCASQGGSQDGSRATAAAAGAAGKKEGKKQASLKAFFQRPAAQQQEQQQQQAQQQVQQQQQEQQTSQQEPAHQQQPPLPAWHPQAEPQAQQPRQQQGQQGAIEAAAAEVAGDVAEALAAIEAAKAAKQQQSKQAWAGLLAKNKPPQCRHGEPAALLKVNKQGPNKGRWFYTCARAAGPPPEGKCNFFKWVEKKQGDPVHLTLGSNGGGKGGGSGGAPGKKSGSGGGGGPASKRLKA
ncbi:hypothetical protein ABPG75_006887 [Micractinium tetrahymenae]